MYNETAINPTAIFINLIFSSPPHFNRKIYKKRYPYQCINVSLDSTMQRGAGMYNFFLIRIHSY